MQYAEQEVFFENVVAKQMATGSCCGDDAIFDILSKSTLAFNSRVFTASDDDTK